MRIIFSLVLFALAATAAAATNSPYLTNSTWLRNGQFLVSGNNAFYVIMQPDGNLCEYMGSDPSIKGETVWCSGTSGPTGQFVAYVTPNANFCVSKGDRPPTNVKPLWCSNKTATSEGPAFLTMNGDGNLIVGTGSPPNAAQQLWNHGIVYSQVSLNAPADGGIKWPDGAVCPGTCAKILRVGTPLSLTAVMPTPKFSVFRAWTGNVCANMTANPCTTSVAATSWKTPIGVDYAPSVTIATVPLSLPQFNASAILSYGTIQARATFRSSTSTEIRIRQNPAGPFARMARCSSLQTRSFA